MLRGVAVADLSEEEFGPRYGGRMGEEHRFLTLTACGEHLLAFAPLGDGAEVLDAMFYPELEGEESVVITLCTRDGAFDPEILARVDHDPEKRKFAAERAWRMNRRTGRIEPVSSRGVVCINESFGL